jgi:TPR repeat protein
VPLTDAAQAQFNLAMAFINGTGVAKNEEIALRWMHAAADAKHVSAIQVRPVVGF